MGYQACWNSTRPNSPALAVDAVLHVSNGRIVFVRRKKPPFQGWWALPGGFVEVGETVEQALVREVKEETGLDVKPMQLIGVFSDPHRDPRGHVVSIAFIVNQVGGELHAGSDATQIQAFSEPPKRIAFDHSQILIAAGLIRSGEDRKSRLVVE